MTIEARARSELLFATQCTLQVLAWRPCNLNQPTAAESEVTIFGVEYTELLRALGVACIAPKTGIWMCCYARPIVTQLKRARRKQVCVVELSTIPSFCATFLPATDASQLADLQTQTKECQMKLHTCAANRKMALDGLVLSRPRKRKRADETDKVKRRLATAVKKQDVQREWQERVRLTETWRLSATAWLDKNEMAASEATFDTYIG